MSRFLPVAKKENIVIQELNDEVLIYDLNLNQAFCLNETSSIIWQMCDGTKNVAEISQAVSRKFNSTVSEGFIWLALEQLKKENLVESEVAPPAEFAGMSRREIIRKVGFASMVALPVVASMIAPTAINAQSGICMCLSPGDCITQSSCPNPNNCNGAMECAP